ncbi:MAG: DUF1003 domain-containing protein [Ardenticatenaceae bacterium]|nr:DUF1003 domain-containing protein [Ardenticatenaceae bacterium]
MKKLQFPEPFKHQHPPIQDVNVLFDQQATIGERAADWVAKAVGSWTFIIGQILLLMLWAVLNIISLVTHWDPYPFILMNLILSLQAAFTAPVIMMSQNRQSNMDRLEAKNDYAINQKAEEEVRAILEHLAAQDEALTLIHDQISKLTSK